MPYKSVCSVGRRLRDEERGVVLAMVAICMVAFLGMGALAIDLGSFRQARQQAQNAADAAALAASSDLPSNPTKATTDANSYVQNNMPGATATVTTPYNSSSSQVKVTVTVTTPAYLGGILNNKSSATVSASAVASETPGQTLCATPGTGCYAIFAMDSKCTDNGFTAGGGTHITGGINSNGSLNVGGGGSTFGPTTYGNGSGCTVSPSGYQSQNNTFTSGPTAQAPVATWPIDYAIDFPACTGAACTGPGGTPSFCTQASTAASWTLVSYNPFTLTSGNIYCGVGSGTAGTPSTWNGAISASQTKNPPIESSYVAGSVTIGGGSDLTACGYTASGYAASGCNAGVPNPATANYPLIYATGTGTAIDESSGGGAFLGDFFAPNGNINFGGGTATTFAEAQQVNASGGAFTGDGPSDTGSGSSAGARSSLIG